MTETELRARYNRLRDQYQMDLGSYRVLQQQYMAVKAEISTLQDQSLILEEARILLQEVGNNLREQAKDALEHLVTIALQYVFGPDFAFEIELVNRNGRSEADFWVITKHNGQEVRVSPEDSRGGGVVDIVSLALRFAVLYLYSHPPVMGPVILDEPTKMLASDLSSQVADFLHYVVKTFGRQLIMVTHDETIAASADTCYRVELVGGKSIATKVTHHL